MKRASYLAILAPLASLALAVVTSTAVGCNDVETSEPPDSAPPPCNQGPFPFPAALGGDQTSTPGCSSDVNPNNLSVIQRLPRGSRYSVGTTVNYVGARDPQGDCNLETVCKCERPGTTQPPPVVIEDAGADADAAPPPAPAPTPSGDPVWTCQ